MDKNSLDNKNMPYKFRYMGNDILVPTTQELNNHSHSWNAITNKPISFTPSSHSHSFDSLTGKPSTYVPSNHNHSYATWLGAQYASGGEWLGFYNKYGGTRKGWIGHNGEDKLYIINETGGELRLQTSGSYSCGINLSRGNANYAGGYFWPTGASTTTLGTAANRWFRLYQSYGSIDISDKRYKENIQIFDKRYENFFMDLKPINHKWKNFNNEKRHDRKHGAFIAQEVKEALYNNDLTEMDFGFYCYDNVSENKELPFNDLHSLAYTEMIPLNTHMIQKLYKKVNHQQKEIDELNSKVNKMIELIRE